MTDQAELSAERVLLQVHAGARRGLVLAILCVASMMVIIDRTNHVATWSR
jgi:hypothetical protein